MRLVTVSFHHPKVATIKSYNPPTSPASSSGLAWSPPLAPFTSTCVVAVASGNGYLPCISLTKYFLKGIRNKIPKMPPNADAMNTCRNDADISGYFACRI